MTQPTTNKIIAQSIWVSDIHIGSCGSQISSFQSFLKNIACKNLFLNGDILDKWLAKNTSPHTDDIIHSFLNQLHQLQKTGTTIIFLPGNHDNNEKTKNIFKSFTFKKEYIYKTIKNKTYLIFHGDQCDLSIKYKSNIIAKTGTHLYEILLKNRKTNNHKKSLSRLLKITTKKILLFLFSYEKKIFNYISNKNLDGVICGHTHQPIIKKINSKDYLNSGDWIDSCTYLIESINGEFKLLNWKSY